MGAEKAKNSSEMAQLIVQEGFNQVETLASESLAKIESGESLLRQLVLLRKITNRLPVNSLQLKLDIGARVVEAEKYSV
jgi:hypothetical protein